MPLTALSPYSISMRSLCAVIEASCVQNSPRLRALNLKLISDSSLKSFISDSSPAPCLGGLWAPFVGHLYDCKNRFPRICTDTMRSMRFNVNLSTPMPICLSPSLKLATRSRQIIWVNSLLLELKLERLPPVSPQLPMSENSSNQFELIRTF